MNYVGFHFAHDLDESDYRERSKPLCDALDAYNKSAWNGVHPLGWKYFRADSRSKALARICGMSNNKPFLNQCFSQSCKRVCHDRAEEGGRSPGKAEARHKEPDRQLDDAMRRLRFSTHLSSQLNVRLPTGAWASGMVWISTGPWSGRQSGEASRDFGAVVLLDAAPDTNTLRWRPFTLLVRDSGASWLPAAHFLVSNTSGVVIEAALTEVKRFVPNWIPRFFVTDHANAEADGIAPFAQAHRLDVRVLACQWRWRMHVEQELAGRHLLGCREWIRLAIYVSVDEPDCRRYGKKGARGYPC